MAEEKPVELAFFIYHPHELWLKGKNRPVFEKRLSENMRHQLIAAGVTNFKVKQMQCEMLVSAPVEYIDNIYKVSKKMFGIAVYSRCYRVERDVEKLKKHIGEHIAEIQKKAPIASFKVETSRVDKRYPTNSMEFSKDVGGYVFETFHIPVNLKQPALAIRIEIQSDCYYYSTERCEGCGGLPVGTSGKVALLLSGGFDSPVAAWSVMRRGCEPVYVHFHSAPYGEWRSSVSKIRKIVGVLREWGGPSTFFCVPIGELQRIIALKCPEKLRVTMYRRLMVRVAAKLAERNKCLALATGDNLGQVASQTIESMTTIQAAVNPMLILRPLLSDSKDEIIQKSRAVGTHDISVMPGGDCCSHMLPKSVATRPSIKFAEEGEKDLDIPAMVEAALSGMQVIDINDPWNEDEEPGESLGCPLTFKE